MNKPDYYVLTQLIIDDVYLPDGTHRLNQLGGGTYTVAGMRIWSENVGFCCAVGPDYKENYDKWFIENGIHVVGAQRDRKCTHARINYFEDGEREELLIPGYGSHAYMMPQVSEIPGLYDSCKGMYLFKDCDPKYWDSAARYLRGHSAVSCWEIFGSTAVPENRDSIADCLSIVDLFSLNLTEGRSLTGETDAVAVLKALFGLGAKNVILRMGARGALVCQGNGVWHIPAVKTNVVDVTGGGNSSTGGFVIGFCESGGDIIRAGICAGVSASFIIQQYGVPERIDAALMKKAEEIAGHVNVSKL